MEPEQMSQEREVTVEPKQGVWNTVTPLSKYLTMVLFIILPFVGGYIGYTLAPEKIVEVEKEVVREVEIERIVEVPVQSNETPTTTEELREPVISVIGYKLDRPGHIEIEYENMPLNAGGLALCVPSGLCTEWVDGNFSPTASGGTYIMETTKGVGTGEFTIMVIGDSFTDQLFVSEPFTIE